MENNDKKRLLLVILFVALAAIAVTVFIIYGYVAKAGELGRQGDEVLTKAMDVKLHSLEEMAANRKIGADDATVKLYVVSSLACSHCADFNKNLLPRIIADYVDTGEVQIVFYDLATGARAMAATMLTRCVVSETMYLKLVDVLYEEQLHWYTAANLERTLIGYGKMAGLSPATTKACLENYDLVKELNKQSNEIRNAYDINSTPSFVLLRGTKFMVIKNYMELVNAIKKF